MRLGIVDGIHFEVLGLLSSVESDDRAEGSRR